MAMRKLFTLVQAFATLFAAGAGLFSCTNPNAGAEQIPVTGVSVDPKGKILTVGDTFQLTATVTPSNATEKGVAWSSSRPDIASVDQKGLVTAVSSGIAAISVTTVDGSMQDECMITVNAGDTPGPGPGPEPSTGLRVRYFSTSGGINTAKDAGDEVSFTLPMGYYTIQRVILYLSESEDGAPLADDVASHYKVTGLEGADGIINPEKEVLFMEKLSGVTTGLFLLEFINPGTVALSMRYDNGEGKRLSKTVKVTIVGAAHELGLNWGIGPAYLAARYLYEGPVNLSEYGSGEMTIWVRPFDITLRKELRDGTFSLDPDNDDPYSNVQYEGAVVPGISTVYPDMEAFRFKITTDGHLGVGIRYEGEFGKIRQTLHFYSPLELKLAETQKVTGDAFFTKDALDVMGSKSLYLMHPYLRSAIAVSPSELKLTGGDASIVDLKLSEDEKSLVFTAKKKGTTTWKIAYDYYGTTLQKTLKVTALEQVAVTGVSLSPTTLSLEAGETGELTATIAPSNASNTAVTWTSSATDIATVTGSGLKGQVKALKEGKATITVKTADGGKTATCQVTVTPKTVSVTGLEWTQAASNLTINLTSTFAVKVLPENATDQTVTWSSQPSNIVSINEKGLRANVKGLHAGTTVVSATCGGKTITKSVTVKPDFSVYWNGSAVSTLMTFQLGDYLNNDIVLRLYDNQSKQFVNPKDYDVSITSSDKTVADFVSTDYQNCYVRAKKRGSVDLTVSVDGFTVRMFAVNVEPIYGVFSALSKTEYYYGEKTEDYVLGYIKSNQLEFRLYDSWAKEFIPVSSGLGGSSTNTSVATITTVTVSGVQYWRVTVKQTGTATLSFSYNGKTIRTLKLNVIAPRGVVDLGLPVKWATMNIGASSPQEPGELFAWGETQNKWDFSWATYVHGKSATSLTKYNGKDGLYTLEAVDDVATERWKWGWRMPTEQEWKDLGTKCTWNAATLNGMSVYKVTGTTGNSIYLPIAPTMQGTSLSTSTTSTVYWSSEVFSSDYSTARTMVLVPSSNYHGVGQVSPRCYGMYVRAVTDRY